MPFNSTSRILITGGTGSFGKAFIAETLRRFPDIKRLGVLGFPHFWELCLEKVAFTFGIYVNLNCLAKKSFQ